MSRERILGTIEAGARIGLSLAAAGAGARALEMPAGLSSIGIIRAAEGFLPENPFVITVAEASDEYMDTRLKSVSREPQGSEGFAKTTLDIAPGNSASFYTGPTKGFTTKEGKPLSTEGDSKGGKRGTLVVAININGDKDAKVNFESWRNAGWETQIKITPDEGPAWIKSLSGEIRKNNQLNGLDLVVVDAVTGLAVDSGTIDKDGNLVLTSQPTVQAQAPAVSALLADCGTKATWSVGENCVTSANSAYVVEGDIEVNQQFKGEGKAGKGTVTLVTKPGSVVGFTNAAGVTQVTLANAESALQQKVRAMQTAGCGTVNGCVNGVTQTRVQ